LKGINTWWYGPHFSVMDVFGDIHKALKGKMNRSVSCNLLGYFIVGPIVWS